MVLWNIIDNMQVFVTMSCWVSVCYEILPCANFICVEHNVVNSFRIYRRWAFNFKLIYIWTRKKNKFFNVSFFAIINEFFSFFYIILIIFFFFNFTLTWKSKCSWVYYCLNFLFFNNRKSFIWWKIIFKKYFFIFDIFWATWR